MSSFSMLLDNHVVEEFKKYSGTRFKNLVLCCTHKDFFLNFSMSIIWFLIPSSQFFFEVVLFFNYLV